MSSTRESKWPTTSKSLVQRGTMEACENCQRALGPNKSSPMRPSPALRALTLPPNAKLLRCSACELTLYCSKECQKAHWKLHKPSCEFERTITERRKAHGSEMVWRYKSLVAWQKEYMTVLCLATVSALRLRYEPETLYTSSVFFRLDVVDTGEKDYKGRTIYSRKIQDVDVLPIPMPPNALSTGPPGLPMIHLPVVLYDEALPDGLAAQCFPTNIPARRVRYYPDWKERLMAVINDGKHYTKWEMYLD